MIEDIVEAGSRASLKQGLPITLSALSAENGRRLARRTHLTRSTLLLPATLLCLFAASLHAQDTTPFQCERLTIVNTRSWVAPILRDFCQKQEASNGQYVAKLLGKPRPSTQVYLLPSHGSAEAARTGLACVGGTAMRRLANGWEQLRDHQHNWVRCRDNSET